MNNTCIRTIWALTLATLITHGLMCAMGQGGAAPANQPPQAAGAVRHAPFPELKNFSARQIAQEIWQGVRVAPTEELETFNIPEETKKLIRTELSKAGGVIDTVVHGWPDGQDFEQVATKPEWLKREFARIWYLRRNREDIADRVGVADIGGFSIKELLDFGLIPAAVPANGILNLFRHKINNLDGFRRITGLNNLRVLLLSSNQLQTLPAEVFAGLNNLQTLQLNNNQLHTLPVGIFAGLNKLQTLWLSVAQLKTLPEGIFAGLNNLQTLQLDHTLLQTLPAGIFTGLYNLQTLWLSSNQLQTLPAGIFAGLNNLQTLKLDYNRLQTLPAEIFTGLNKLQTLWLYNNQLHTLPAKIFNGLNNLRALDLHNNQLHTLPEGIFNGLNHLRELGLYDNPWWVGQGIEAMTYSGAQEIQALRALLQAVPRE
jgi:Leucine-rich repeat (LRR) protein